MYLYIDNYIFFVHPIATVGGGVGPNQPPCGHPRHHNLPYVDGGVLVAVQILTVDSFHPRVARLRSCVFFRRFRKESCCWLIYCALYGLPSVGTLGIAVPKRNYGEPFEEGLSGKGESIVQNVAISEKHLTAEENAVSMTARLRTGWWSGISEL